jgi:predicted RNase H-like HicB family nuclease
MEREFTAVIEKRDQWYVAYVEEIPGVNTQGRTLAEARRNLREALRLILETNRRQQLRTQQERRDSRPRRTHGCRMRAA